MSGAVTAGFETESFTWSDGTFELRGTWSDDADGLGRVRLLVEVDGRRRNIGAQGGKTAGGAEWRARFMCAHPPDPGTPVAMTAGDAEIVLPVPELREPEPLDAPDTQTAAGLLEHLRAERAAADIARQRLARERRAAEEAEQRLLATRRRLAPETTRRSATRATRAEAEALGYAVAAAIGLLFLIVLIWLL